MTPTERAHRLRTALAEVAPRLRVRETPERPIIEPLMTKEEGRLVWKATLLIEDEPITACFDCWWSVIWNDGDLAVLDREGCEHARPRSLATSATTIVPAGHP